MEQELVPALGGAPDRRAREERGDRLPLVEVARDRGTERGAQHPRAARETFRMLM